MRKRIFYIILLAGLLGGCKKGGDGGTTVAPDAPERPASFPTAYYKHVPNTYSQAGFELGRKLFHDSLLSVNNTVSCASCHKQEFAFSDGGIVLSKGIDGQTAKRHTPAIFNMAWNTSFMWDGGVNNLEVMPLAPLTNHLEMGETIKHIIYKLNRDQEYPTLFKNVFHRDSIDDQQMFWAIAQYMSNLVSAHAKYDRIIAGTDRFNPEEQEGYALFKANCATCHKEPLFTDYSYQNNGLDASFADSGRFRITQSAPDIGKFKVPTLRNVAVTYPYMHDGRFATLSDVLKHYASGIKSSATLSDKLAKDGKPGLSLTEDEQNKIILFLQTLTDSTLLTNKYYTQ